MPAVLTAALLLLLGGTAPRARADGAAGSYDPRDLNQDGTVTGKERRQYRRMNRRQGTGSGADADPGNSADAAADAQAHSDAAGQKASAAAAALKSSLASPDAGLGAGGGPGAAKSASAAAKPGAVGPGVPAKASSGAKASGDPSNPAAPSDFVLAARSGYAPAFATAGLKLSADGRTIVRADGSAATAEDYARLRGAILQLPAALSRRPDFFSAVSPSHFNMVKEGYRGSPGPKDPVYKDVGTTAEDRDFVHTASCAKMSGECNENADKSYKKGDYVAPEDLDRMWASLQKEVDSAESENGDGLGALHGPSFARKSSDVEPPDSKDGVATGGAGNAAKAAAAGAAAPAGGGAALQAARGVWRATRSILGLGASSSDAPGSGSLELGALGAAALAALVFALRKKT